MHNILLGKEIDASVTPQVGPCEDCFGTAFASLSTAQIEGIVPGLGVTGSSFQSVCELGVINGDSLQTQLNLVGFSQAQIDALILCLEQARIKVTPIEF